MPPSPPVPPGDAAVGPPRSGPDPALADAPTVLSSPAEEIVHTGESAVWGRPLELDARVPEGAALEDRFELLEQIGEGGMGKVSLGVDRALLRKVAIKELHASLLDHADAAARFRREAQIVAQLEHPGIVPVYAAEQHRDGPPAFSMKYVRGRTLSDYLDQCTTACGQSEDPSPEFSLSTRLTIFIKVCEAITFAHARGVVHRDLKPDNIMIGAFGEVYVMDWGIARIVGAPDRVVDSPLARAAGAEAGAITRIDTDRSDLATRAGALVGTATHMPPEQARGELERVGPPADQYALGMILRELVTFEPPRPYHGDFEDLVRRACKNDNAPLRHRHGRRLSPALVAIIETATATDPDRRYPGVAELAADVGRFQRGEEVSVRRDGPIQRVGRLMARHPAPVLAALLCVVLVAGVVVVASLLETIEVRARSGRRAEQVSELTSYVAAVARDFDRSSGEVRAQVAALASEVQTRLGALAEADDDFGGPEIQRGAARPPWHAAASFDGPTPPGTAYTSERYGRPISHLEPSYWLARDGDPELGARHLRTLAPIYHRMRDMSVRSFAPDRAGAPEALQSELLGQERALLQFVYVGLESGLLLNYPGIGGFTPEYDPRRRPWYGRVAGSHAPSFGAPYLDVAGTGILIPCNTAIYGDAGELLGVVGADVLMSGVQRALVMDHSIVPLARGTERPPLPGWRHSALVDPEGRTVIDSRAADDRSGGVNDNRSLDAPPYPNPRVRELIASGASEGLIYDGDAILVLSRLNVNGWYLVVQVDAAAYDGHPRDATTP